MAPMALQAAPQAEESSLMGDDLQSRIEATARVLREAASLVGMTITGDGRVGEADAAQLLGMAAGSLKNQRTEGRGPPAYMRGVAGMRVSYRLDDLARWIEGGREE